MRENEKHDGRGVGEGTPRLARLRQLSEMSEEHAPWHHTLGEFPEGRRFRWPRPCFCLLPRHELRRAARRAAPVELRGKALPAGADAGAAETAVVRALIGHAVWSVRPT